MTRTLPGSGLTGFWPLGDNTYKAAMDANLRTISVMLAGSVVSRTTTLPGSGVLGAVYIVPSGAPSNANNIAIWDGASGDEAWVYLTPKLGWHLYVDDTNENVQWDGSAWVVFAGSGGGGGAADVLDGGAVIVSSALQLNFTGAGVTVTDGGGGQADISIPGGGGGSGAYDIVVGFVTQPASNGVFSTIPVVTAFELPANLTGSIGRVGINPSGSYVFTIRKNGTTVATVTVSTGGAFTMTTVGGFVQSFAAGDILTAQGPAGVDATIASLVFALKGTTS